MQQLIHKSIFQIILTALVAYAVNAHGTIASGMVVNSSQLTLECSTKTLRTIDLSDLHNIAGTSSGQSAGVSVLSKKPLERKNNDHPVIGFITTENGMSKKINAAVIAIPPESTVLADSLQNAKNRIVSIGNRKNVQDSIQIKITSLIKPVGLAGGSYKVYRITGKNRKEFEVMLKGAGLTTKYSKITGKHLVFLIKKYPIRGIFLGIAIAAGYYIVYDEDFGLPMEVPNHPGLNIRLVMAVGVFVVIVAIWIVLRKKGIMG